MTGWLIFIVMVVFGIGLAFAIENFLPDDK
jgi:hypothetical protein